MLSRPAQSDPRWGPLWATKLDHRYCLNSNNLYSADAGKNCMQIIVTQAWWSQDSIIWKFQRKSINTLGSINILSLGRFISLTCVYWDLLCGQQCAGMQREDYSPGRKEWDCSAVTYTIIDLCRWCWRPIREKLILSRWLIKALQRESYLEGALKDEGEGVSWQGQASCMGGTF